MACDEEGHRSHVLRRKREEQSRGDKVWRREKDGEKPTAKGVRRWDGGKRGRVRDRAMRIERGKKGMRAEASETRRGIEQTRVDSDMRVSRKPVTPRFPWQRQAINQPATSPSTVR